MAREGYARLGTTVKYRFEEGFQMKGPQHIETERLLLRPPTREDARAIFDRYASDPEVVRYVSFPRHTSLDDTRAFLDWSLAEWDSWPAGPYLICSRSDDTVLGSTGLSFNTPSFAETGYVLARDSWGRGYATEALRAMVELAAGLGVQHLRASCHPDHRPSQRVLEKGGFEVDETEVRKIVFPNLDPDTPVAVLSYSLAL